MASWPCSSSGAGGWGTAAVAVLRRVGWETGARRDRPAVAARARGLASSWSWEASSSPCDLARFDVLVAWHVVGVVLLADACRRGGAAPEGAHASARALRPRRRRRRGGSRLDLARDRHRHALLQRVRRRRRLRLPGQAPVEHGGPDRPVQRPPDDELRRSRRCTSRSSSTCFGNSSLRGFEFTFASLLLVIVTVGTHQATVVRAGDAGGGTGDLPRTRHRAGPEPEPDPVRRRPVARRRTSSWPRSGPRPRPTNPGSTSSSASCWAGSWPCASTTSSRWSWPRSSSSSSPGAGDRCGRSSSPGASAIISVSGWAVALYRSSRTPLFPLFEGNYNPSYPVGPNPLAVGIGSYAHQIWGVLNGYDVGWVACSPVSPSPSGRWSLRARRPSGRWWCCWRSGVGCVAQMFIFTVIFSGFAAIEIDRFEAPSTLACGLFAARTRCGRAATRSRRRPGPEQPRPGRCSAARAVPWRRAGAGGVDARAAARAGHAHLRRDARCRVADLHHPRPFGVRRPAGHDRLPRPLRRASSPSTPTSTRPCPRGPRCSPRWTTPRLLSFSRYQFATLDLAGSVSPPPHMPYFKGAAGQGRLSPAPRLRLHRRRLRDRARPLPVQGPWENDLHSPRYNYRAWAPYFLDWMSTVTTLEHATDYGACATSAPWSLIEIGPLSAEGRRRRLADPGRAPGQKIPAARPAASVAPSSRPAPGRRARSSPTTVTGGSTRRHRRPVAMPLDAGHRPVDVGVALHHQA